jgi:orotate phosphoribosyltransferase
MEVARVIASDETNLWLARALFDVGGISFGDFTIGRTAVHSPIYINPRLLISEPGILRRVAKLIETEVKAAQARRRPRVSPFSLVAGVPFGGLHLATAFSLETDIPMIYARPRAEGSNEKTIEGVYRQGQRVLIIDDLITGGGSVLETASLLEQAGLVVRDAIVLIDREQGAAERLHQRGINLISILRLKTMLNYYLETGLIEPAWYDRSMVYLETNRPTAE